MAYTNNNGQSRVGVRIVPQVNASSLWNSIYSVYNADAVGSSSLKTSLVAAYNGESNANDSFGTNNGTAQGGLTYGTGKIGNAFTFNGSNSYVSLPENSIRFTNSFSTSFWLKTTVNQTGGGGLISDYYWGSEDWGYIIRLRTDNKISVFWRKDSTFNSVVSSSALSLNQWNHVSVVWDKVNTNWKIYINGVLDNQLTSVNASNITYAVGSNRTNIGSINSYGPDCLNGSMDSINFWNKTLTQSEITELYNSGNGAQYITDSFYKPTTNDALNLRNGTAQGGLTYGVGKVGTAFQFNGSNAYVQLPNNSLQFTNKFSASMWMYIPSNVSHDQILVGCFRFTGIWKGWGISMYQNTIYFYIGAGSAGKVDITYGDNSLIGSWAHLVAIHENGIGSKLYVNGVLRATVTNINPIVYDSSEISSIGCAFVGGGGLPTWFMKNGSKLDALNIYNRVLTSTEVTELYNSGNGKQYPN